jgi:cyclin-dependent kinase regulatory subunit CKS1
VCRIHYSERYSDDDYEYRHVILPKPLLKLIPKQYFNPDDSGVLRLLSEAEWRGIGITQSLGWEHYEVHGECSWVSTWIVSNAFVSAPEPHVLLFRRAKNFDAVQAQEQLLLHQQQLNAKAKPRRK